MKHILFYIFTFCFSTTTYCQDFTAENFRVFPGEYNSHEDFHMDNTGNYYVAGRGTGAIDFDFGAGSTTLPETSWKDLYLAKYNANGELQWLNSFDGTVISNQIRTIVSDANGNVYIGGTFSGTLNLTDDGQNEITSFGSSSMFVAKFDVDGNLLWQFTVGDTNFSQWPDQMYIYNNKLIIQFVYTGTFDVDPGAGETILDGSSNAMLVYNLDGGFIEANSHRNNTKVNASVMDADGNLYLGGLFSGLVSFDYKSNASVISEGLFDAFIVKYDSDFNLVWVKTVGKFIGALTFTNLDLDSNNDLVASGSFESGTEIGSFTAENDGNYIVHLTQDGDFTNLMEFLPESSFISKLAVTASDQLIISARFTENVDIDLTEEVKELTPMEDNDNYFFAVYESDLTLLGVDQIYATDINTHTVFVGEMDQIHILTDFKGDGKIAFGSTDNYTSAEEESFVSYSLDIAGCTPTSEEISVEACKETIINGEMYTSSGQYEQILTNAEGCDSVIHILLVIYPETELDTSIVSCGEFYIFNGELILDSGTYFFILNSINGCDSLVTLNLDVIDIVDSITINENELMAVEEDGDTYQWYDCDTDMAIEGATEVTFTPETSGSYRVQIFKGACSFFTDCINFTLVNTVEHNFEITISPNPTSGILNINNRGENSDYKYSLLNISGRKIELSNPINSSGLIDMTHLNSGIYLLKIEKGSEFVFKNIIKY